MSSKPCPLCGCHDGDRCPTDVPLVVDHEGRKLRVVVQPMPQRPAAPKGEKVRRQG